MLLLFYTTYISVDLAHREIVRAKVGKGSISWIITMCYSYLKGCFISQVNISDVIFGGQ